MNSVCLVIQSDKRVTPLGLLWIISVFLLIYDKVLSLIFANKFSKLKHTFKNINCFRIVNFRAEFDINPNMNDRPLPEDYNQIQQEPDFMNSDKSLNFVEMVQLYVSFLTGSTNLKFLNLKLSLVNKTGFCFSQYRLINPIFEVFLLFGIFREVVCWLHIIGLIKILTFNSLIQDFSQLASVHL